MTVILMAKKTPSSSPLSPFSPNDNMISVEPLYVYSFRVLSKSRPLLSPPSDLSLSQMHYFV